MGEIPISGVIQESPLWHNVSVCYCGVLINMCRIVNQRLEIELPRSVCRLIDRYKLAVAKALVK